MSQRKRARRTVTMKAKKQRGRGKAPCKDPGYDQRRLEQENAELRAALRASAKDRGIRMGREYRALAETSSDSEEEFLTRAMDPPSSDPEDPPSSDPPMGSRVMPGHLHQKRRGKWQGRKRPNMSPQDQIMILTHHLSSNLTIPLTKKVGPAHWRMSLSTTSRARGHWGQPSGRKASRSNIS